MLDLAKERLVIQERNRIRAEARLPILSVAHELRRAYDLRRWSKEFLMAPRAYWKGYLKLSLVSCPKRAE